MEENYFEVEDSGPLPSAPEQADDAPQSDLEPPQRPRPPSRRKFLAQISLLLVALVAVAVVARGALVPARPTGAVDTPMPTTPPPPATTLLLSNVTFGTVTINGQQQQATAPLFFSASRTRYQITIDAPPLNPQTCTVFFTDNGPQIDTSISTCQNVGASSFPMMTLNGITATPLYALEMGFTADDLTSDQQQQINTLLAHTGTVRQTTTAPAGSYIATKFNADNTITSQRITSPLQATAFLTTSATSPLMESPEFKCQGLICPQFCDPLTCSEIPGAAWLIGVPVTMRWRFTAAGGHVAGDVTFPALAVVPKLLTYNATTGWSLSSEPLPEDLGSFGDIGTIDCQTGSQVLEQLFANGGFGYAMASGGGVEGCMIIGESTNGADPGNFVWRFGVLLAADDAAHQSLPNLPMAPQAEINIVQGKGSG